MNHGSYKGIVRGGVVVLERKAKLEDGTAVRVAPVHTPTPRRANTTRKSAFSKRYGDLVGSIKGMPRDLAEEHDHYIHGTPRRK